MRKISVGALALILSLGVTGTASAQKFGAWGGQVYGGYGVPISDNLNNYTSGGFSWGGGVNYSPEAAPWAIRLDIRNSRFPGDEAAIRKTLDSIADANPGGADISPANKDGYFRTWDFALAGEIGTSKDAKFRAYVLGGVNFSNKYAALTEPGVASGCYWDPWWGYICGSGVYEEVVANTNVWEFGYNFGGGISADVGRGARVFIETVYTSIGGSTVTAGDTTREGKSVGYLPIYIGVRF